MVNPSDVRSVADTGNPWRPRHSQDFTEPLNGKPMGNKFRKLDEASDLARGAFWTSASGLALRGKQRQVCLGMLRDEHGWVATFSWVPKNAGKSGCVQDLTEPPLLTIVQVTVPDGDGQIEVVDLHPSLPTIGE